MAGKKPIGSPISDEDSLLFREAVGEVKPVDSERQQSQRKKPPAEPRVSEADELSVMDELLSDFSELDLLETGEHLSYTSPGVQRSVLKNLKSGKYAIQSELDLHGYSGEQSREKLRIFLHKAQENERHCVRIIHGRGRKKADQPPVLKPLVAQLLYRHKQVLAFCSARDSDGGTGAVYVLLRKRKKQSDNQQDLDRSC